MQMDILILKNIRTVQELMVKRICLPVRVKAKLFLENLILISNALITVKWTLEPLEVTFTLLGSLLLSLIVLVRITRVGLLIFGLIFVTLLVHKFSFFGDMIFLMFKVCLSVVLMREALYILADSNTVNSMLLVVFSRLELVINTSVGIQLV
jgi:hypothetical protein